MWLCLSHTSAHCVSPVLVLHVGTWLGTHLEVTIDVDGHATKHRNWPAHGDMCRLQRLGLGEHRKWSSVCTWVCVLLQVWVGWEEQGVWVELWVKVWHKLQDQPAMP